MVLIKLEEEVAFIEAEIEHAEALAEEKVQNIGKIWAKILRVQRIEKYIERNEQNDD